MLISKRRLWGVYRIMADVESAIPGSSYIRLDAETVFQGCLNLGERIFLCWKGASRIPTMCKKDQECKGVR